MNFFLTFPKHHSNLIVTLIIHNLYIFGKKKILIRVTVDLVSITGHETTLNERSVNIGHYAHTFKPKGNLAQPVWILAGIWEVE